VRWSVLTAMLGATGCSSILGIEDFKLVDAARVDEAGPIDAAPGCFGPVGFFVCPMPLPTEPIVFDNSNESMLATDTSARCLPMQPMAWKLSGQPDACFVVATTIEIDVSVVAQGMRPLVLVATESIVVKSTLDVAAHRLAGTSAPGAPSPACSQPGSPQDADSATRGAGGGAGGSFMSKGGNGGAGETGALAGGFAGELAAMPTTLRGGCDGGSAGKNFTGAQPEGGKGGGAVMLAAGTSITIDGAINASGAGGNGGFDLSGGAGGGSGGMIVLHAPTITGIGVVIANGGGGGAGGETGNVAEAGSDPSPATPLAQASGGSGVDGGRGFARDLPATGGLSGAAAQGGGGGGGGGGFIRASTSLGVITVSPPATIVP
jgi:hypothetical protein